MALSYLPRPHININIINMIGEGLFRRERRGELDREAAYRSPATGSSDKSELSCCWFRKNAGTAALFELPRRGVIGYTFTYLTPAPVLEIGAR